MPKVLNQPLSTSNPVVLGAAPTSSQPGNTLIPPGHNGVKVTMQNPGTATIFIEGSDDQGVSWHDLAALRCKDGTTVDSNSGSGFSPTGGKNTSWVVPCAGCNQVRVRATALTGTGLVSITSFVCPPYGLL